MEEFEIRSLFGVVVKCLVFRFHGPLGYYYNSDCVDGDWLPLIALRCDWLYFSVETAAALATARRRSATRSTVAAARSPLQATRGLLHPLEAFTPLTCRLAVNTGGSCTRRGTL